MCLSGRGTASDARGCASRAARRQHGRCDGRNGSKAVIGLGVDSHSHSVQDGMSGAGVLVSLYSMETRGVP